MTIALGRGLAASRAGGPQGVRRFGSTGRRSRMDLVNETVDGSKKLRVPGDRSEICVRHRDEPLAPEQLGVHHVVGIGAMIGAGVLALTARLARSAPAPAPPPP
jgi:hypothetical protein